MHPMDTGLVGGIPAFYVNRLSVRDAAGPRTGAAAGLRAGEREPGVQLRLRQPPAGGVRIVGTDNNGNRIDSQPAMKRCFLAPLLRCLLAVCACWRLGAAPKADPARAGLPAAGACAAPGVWVVEGDNADFSVANGCNIINTGFIATGAGVLVINTGPSRLYGEQLRALIAAPRPEPVVQVLHLNLHPDYFLGNQAFADVPRWPPRPRAPASRARPPPTRPTCTACAATG
jgi:hypothetical protein